MDELQRAIGEYARRATPVYARERPSDLAAARNACTDRMQTLEALERELQDCEALSGTYRNIGSSIGIRAHAQRDLEAARKRRRGRIKKVFLYLWYVLIALIVASEVEQRMSSALPESIYAALDLCLSLAVFALPAALVYLGTIEQRGAVRRAQQALDKAQSSLDAESRRYVNGYRARKRTVSFEDWNVPTLQALVEIVHRGRADTVKEALNILEADRHRERLEKHAQEQADLQKLIIEELKQTQRDIILFS